MKQRTEESVKRERGRPKKMTKKKSDYNHVLFKTSFFKPQPPEEKATLSEEQQRQRLIHYLEKIQEICEVADAAEYYWRLVFTATFHLYRERKQRVALETGADDPPIVTPSDMAADAGMEYFNLKNLFLGRGTARNIFSLLRFLHEQSIDFDQIQYNESIIDRAYAFLMILRQNGIDHNEARKLFFATELH